MFISYIESFGQFYLQNSLSKIESETITNSFYSFQNKNCQTTFDAREIFNFYIGWWFSPGTPVSSTNKTDRNIVESGAKHHKPKPRPVYRKGQCPTVNFIQNKYEAEIWIKYKTRLQFITVF